MNFPLEYPIFRFLLWFLDTAGIGGAVAIVAALGSVVGYALVLRWIAQGAKANEEETYAYPTPTLHQDHDGHR